MLRLGSLVVAAVSLAALALLWTFRPEGPELPNSLSSPVTTAMLQQLAIVASWLLAAVVILVLLVLSHGGIRARRRFDSEVAWLTTTGRVSRPQSLGATPGITRPLPTEPPLLVIAPPDLSPTHRGEELVATSSRPTSPRDAAFDEDPVISLLGPLTIHGGKRSRRGLRARALELIAFLALRREGAQRDEILEALWPGEDPKRSRHRLYQAVRDARRLLGDAVASERDRYWLDRTLVRVDVDEIDALLEKVHQADDGRTGEKIEKALTLFRAEPLAGCDYAWSEGEVRSLRATYMELLEQAGRARLAAGDARGALEAAERALAIDVLNEASWRLALEAESRLGLRDAVAQRYELLCRLLDERLGLEPQRETRRLYRRLLGQE
jgi:DNA-binding SARP family transcriptional activator